MGRQPCCDKVGLKKGPWTAEEDKKLINFILTNGQCCWRAVPKLAGLLRCGKSCRLRWTNYLRPDLKRGLLSEYEEKMVIDLHAQLGNRWSKIASHLTGRTDNEIKNHWNTHIKKKLKKMGIDPLTHKPLPTAETPPPPPLSPPSPPPSSQTQEQETKTQEDNVIIELEDNTKETSTETSSSVITDQETKLDQDEKNSMFESMEIMMDGFCVDEVPLIQPHEMLVHYGPTPQSSSSSTMTTSSTSSSSCHDSKNNNNNNFMFEELQISDFEWPNNEIDLWSDVFCWDLLMNDDIDRNLQDGIENNQSQRMIFDHDSWTYGIM